MIDQPTGALPPPSGTELTWNEVLAEEPKPARDWTADTVRMFGETCWNKESCKDVAYAHNAALDAERENARTEKKRYSAATWDMADLRRELAAEREKVQTLVDALEFVRKAACSGGGPREITDIIDETLAKAKESH